MRRSHLGGIVAGARGDVSVHTDGGGNRTLDVRQTKRPGYEARPFIVSLGAGEGIRTLDPNLGNGLAGRIR
ncbi:protein of unknown function [Magnetospirillum gryphiswaldense MSR-1 v2]|uniref:Uncharacterized protein n=1 Tax=Magnetospirillum gryphiswaldense (strain DSM 6361 / JCM 21280 / NBRC 15271 / MSR-1) TaxID=431944 RepID=V6F595_MAGGM|nr:protein of unknown function [Magnetospirillum gryphiswaldense MSR-1 v2]